MPDPNAVLEQTAGLNTIAVLKAKNYLRFQALAKEWREHHRAMSSITEMSMLPAYQKIIGMGADAVPLILEQLKAEGNEPDQWFWALRAIAEENPVAPEDQGDFLKMAQAWIRWGEGHAG